MTLDADAVLVDTTMRGAGWVGAFDGFAGTDVQVSGFGEVALQLPNEEAHALLRLEYHAKGPDGVQELHFHVSDESDSGVDFVLRAPGQLADVLAAIVAVQQQLSLDTVGEIVPSIADVCAEAYIVRDGHLQRIKRDPAVRAEFGRAVDLANEGSFEEALASFEKVIAADPEHEVAFEYAAQVSRELGDFPRMARIAAAWCEAYPESTAPWLSVSIALQNMKELPTALEMIDHAIELDEDDGTLHYQRACVLALSGHASESLASIRDALEREPALREDIASDADLAILRDNTEFRALTRAAN